MRCVVVVVVVVVLCLRFDHIFSGDGGDFLFDFGADLLCAGANGLLDVFRHVLAIRGLMTETKRKHHRGDVKVVCGGGGGGGDSTKT